MAPEQARGNPALTDERSDVFGLGAVLYQMITGGSPYGSDPAVHIERACAGEVMALDASQSKTAISPRLVAIVNKALEPDPDRRYQSVLELQEDLRQFLRGGLYLPQEVYAPGKPIVCEGDVGDAAFLILQGRCRAFRTADGKEETLATMGPGEVFGEMALLLDEPRAATVVAVDEVTVSVLDYDTLHAGLGLDGWTGALVKALAKRFFELEQRVRRAGISRAPVLKRRHPR
jgi:serine/threonine-protein kinase